MSAKRIDHAAEAVALLARADLQGTDPLGDTLRLDAFVHATLAAAEQQRIANLLALLGNRDVLSDEAVQDHFAETDRQRGHARNEIRASIREGLGL